MSNIFKDVLDDAAGVEQKLLGPDYPYWKNINTPSQIGMSSDGNLGALGRDVSGLKSYVELLVSGSGEASATGGPLGNRFFLKTGGKCNSNSDPNGDPVLEDRYIYIDNIPQGNIPFISSGMGMNFSELKGLIPGAMSDMSVLNPFAIMAAFMEGTNPQCQAITMETVGPTPPPTSLPTNAKGQETYYVALADISGMSACSFSDRKNPLTGLSCVEAFETNKEEKKEKYIQPFVVKDPIVSLYFFSLGILAIYILYCLTSRKRY